MTLGILLFAFGFLFGPSAPAQAHNGAVAIAMPMGSITLDGNFSDWPDDLTAYDIAILTGDRLQGESDFAATFRIGYNPVEDALYLAVEVRDESNIGTSATREDSLDGCILRLAESHGDQAPLIGEYVLLGKHLATRAVEDAGVSAQMGQAAGGRRNRALFSH